MASQATKRERKISRSEKENSLEETFRHYGFPPLLEEYKRRGPYTKKFINSKNEIVKIPQHCRYDVINPYSRKKMCPKKRSFIKDNRSKPYIKWLMWLKNQENETEILSLPRLKIEAENFFQIPISLILGKAEEGQKIYDHAVLVIDNPELSFWMEFARRRGYKINNRLLLGAILMTFSFKTWQNYHSWREEMAKEVPITYLIYHPTANVRKSLVLPMHDELGGRMDRIRFGELWPPREILNPHIPISLVFQHPTVRELCVQRTLKALMFSRLEHLLPMDVLIKIVMISCNNVLEDLKIQDKISIDPRDHIKKIQEEEEEEEVEEEEEEEEEDDWENYLLSDEENDED